MPTRCARVDRLERDVVAGLEERERRRRRRREAVRQQVQELEQARRAARRGSPTSDRESSRSVRKLASRFSARCRARRVDPACVSLDRAPTTRSYSPSRATRRSASAGWCWPSPSMMRMYSPVGGADAALHGRAVALVVRMPDDARAGRRGARARLVGRSVVDDEDLAPGARPPASSRTTSPIAPASLQAGMTTETTPGSAISAIASGRRRAVAASRSRSSIDAHAIEQILEQLARAGDHVGDAARSARPGSRRSSARPTGSATGSCPALTA